MANKNIAGKVPQPNNLWSNAGKGILVPHDVGSRIQGEEFNPYSLDGVRDFIVDGLGSVFYDKNEYPYISHDRRYIPKDLYKEGIQRKKHTELKAARYKQKLKDNNQTNPINGIATSGEFKGFELEGGMPSYEATKMMTDQEFKAYEKKYLLDEVDDDTSAMDRVRSFAAQGATPLSLKYGASALDSVRKLKDQYQKDGAGSMIQDVGNGTMSRLAAPFSKTSSDWWKNRLNTKDGEAGSLGKNIADEAMLGVAGGVIGKGIGTAYKGLKRSGEMYSHRVSKLAKEQEQMVMSNLTLKNKLKHQAQLVKQKTYENMTAVPKPKPWTSVDGVSHNVKRVLDDRGMLDSNSKELNNLFEKLGSLNKARKAQRANWDQLPGQGMKIGTGLGLGAGAGVFTGSNITTTKEPKASNTNLPKPWTSGTGVGSMGKLKSTGTDGI